MDRHTRYVIECRNAKGELDFTKPQPEDVFGTDAITGISEEAMARAVWRHKPDASLSGQTLLLWPREIDSRWYARRKTW